MPENSIAIRSALISVFSKDGLEPVLELLHRHNVKLYSTGGTQKFIEEKGYKSTPVEDITDYPSILGGRVKTLHPKIFGGILQRRQHNQDQQDAKKYDIPPIDLVIVDLYPFEDTLASGASHEDIVEKIDIGGVSLIRAAAKNYTDVVIVPSREEYPLIQEVLESAPETTEEIRKLFAARAFTISSGYDQAISDYLGGGSGAATAGLPGMEMKDARSLRYGENPHQKGIFYGKLEEAFEQLHGKELSYNNLLDIEAATGLIAEFDNPAFVVIKHNNPCGVATGGDLTEVWKDALAGDPVSAFGGILITNKKVYKEVAEKINKIFFEVLIAPDFDEDALKVLKQKKNRILLKQKQQALPPTQFRSLLNGILVQDRDTATETEENFSYVTTAKPAALQIKDLIFANKIVKHAKSNAIVLVRNHQLIGIGVGQTSRIDALKQAIEKAYRFNFELKGAVMASDAFFPFPDSVEIAGKAGITAVVQPGGSIKDRESIDYCNKNKIAMVTTGTRHFKH